MRKKREEVQVAQVNLEPATGIVTEKRVKVRKGNHFTPPENDKQRKAKRRMSNASRRVNQAKAR